MSILLLAPAACRNAAEFDPTVNLTGSATQLTWNYESLVLGPTLAAAQAALSTAPGRRNIRLSLGLGSELGRSFTVYAAKWQQVTARVKAALAAMVDNSAVGPQFDPTKLCG
jgi:hypothetical protein